MRRSLHRFIPVVAAAVGLLTGPHPIAAVTNIRFERWGATSTGIPRDIVAPHDSTTSLGVSFDAISTIADADPARGFRFALAERSAGQNRILVPIEAHPCGVFPAPGSDVLVNLGVFLYCDAQGRLHARDSVTWHVTWCDVPDQQHCMPQDGQAAEPPGVADPEAFEFVLLDENGNEGANPTPEDFLHAGPGGPFVHFEAPDFAPSGSIGLFRDPGGNLCSDFVQPLVPFRWYVVERLEGMTRCGLSAAYFVINGLPPGVIVTVTPNPHATVAFTNPFVEALVGFRCERGDGNAVVLYTIDGVTTVPLNDVELTVAQGPATVPEWPYPWTGLCPVEIGSRRRVVGTSFVVNPAPGRACDPTVQVERTTWTQIKGLYRENHVTPLR